MKTVTYRGADDPRDPTTRYRSGEHRFPKGVPVYDVPDELAAELEQTEGHTFEITENSATEPAAAPHAQREASAEAKKLASRHGIALDSIEGDGPIGPDDVRAAIEAAAQN